MEWTTEKPKDVGFYWVWHTQHSITVNIAHISRGKSGLFVVIYDTKFLLDDFTHFMGPVSIPDPPVE